MLGNDPYAELLRLCAQGDQQAFARLYKLTSPKLYGLALRMMKTRQAAEEVLQEGYLKIWNGAASFNSSRASSLTWMSTVIRNRALDVIRSANARPQEVESEYEGPEFASTVLSPEEGAGLSLSAKRVMDCMEELPEKQRISLLKAYYYGYTHDELARELGRPLGTVKAWVRRGLERLRQCLS